MGERKRDGGDEPGDASDGDPSLDPTDLRFVGPATAGVLREAGIDPGSVPAKRVSHAQLRAAGVNPGVAAKLRRWHSLAWSFEGGADLDRRAEQVRGLGDDERAWVAASAGDWQSGAADRDGSAAGQTDRDGSAATASADGSGDAAGAESAWRDRSRPVPVTHLDGIGERRAEALARAGINSVRSMALADPDEVAESLDLSPTRVKRWRKLARERL